MPSLTPALRCLALALLVAALPAWAATERFADALLAEGGDAFRADGAKVVALPDDWAATRPGRGGTLWYRLRFDAVGAREQRVLLGLWVERACANAHVVLNGQPLAQSGRLVPTPDLDCETPRLFALPGALLADRGNTVDLRLAGHALGEVASRQRVGGLSAPLIGPHAELEPLHRRTLWQRIALPQAASTALLLMGAVAFVMGWWHRRERHLAWFGAMSMAWALVTARLWWPAPPWPRLAVEAAIVTAVALAACFAVQFLLHYAGQRRRRIGVALGIQCLLVPLSVAAAGASRVHAVATLWYALFALQMAGAIVYLVGTNGRTRRGDVAPLMLFVLAGAATIGLEFVAAQQAVPPWARTLPTIVMPLAFIGLGLWLVHRHGRALQSAEELRASLETRIRDSTAAMEKSYAQMAELRVEQVTQQERKRIAADLHDDLGAKLLTIVHTSESERISTLAREALEEMRLSVRGLTGKPVMLIDALGDWRAEVVGRLSQTGVEGEWQAPHDDLPQKLSARAYVQTTRILREAVNNIIKHSGASRCSIRCMLDGSDFKLAIQDNGKGIPLELDGRLDRGHGMASMKHRAKQLHGQCLVESGPGYGTVIRLTIPLEKHTLPT
ncbi:MAG TPA: ATP-binding protein [Burkholderiaceae bacterium]|nr:ATP-binding protein [Burkholderiaceae bacterium]